MIIVLFLKFVESIILQSKVDFVPGKKLQVDYAKILALYLATVL